jgi:hypothetical protein
MALLAAFDVMLFDMNGTHMEPDAFGSMSSVFCTYMSSVL